MFVTARKNSTLILHWWSRNAPGVYSSKSSASRQAGGDNSAEQKQIKLTDHKTSNFAAEKGIYQPLSFPCTQMNPYNFWPRALANSLTPHKLPQHHPKLNTLQDESKEKTHHCDRQRESLKANDERSPEPDRSHQGLEKHWKSKKKNSLH